MLEQKRFGLALTAAETMYHLWELARQQEALDLAGVMRRLKDLSAYLLTHAEIMDRREGVELLVLGMFFGASSLDLFPTVARPQRLSENVYETLSKAIVQGELPPTERLRETQMAEALGVSRTPVREAFVRLKQ